MFIWLIFLGVLGWAAGQTTETQYLSGLGPESAVSWDFFCTGGRRSGQWTTINVPSNWECEGFGRYNYGHDRNKSDEQGKYRTVFQLPDLWKDKKIHLVFEGVMTDTAVFVNGTPAGPVHQGGFYEFAYDITPLVKWGADNLLEVNVSKVSANASVEAAERQADYWVFGGIFRPVYLKAVPAESIERIAIDARADGTFRIDVQLSGIASCDRVTVQILDEQSEPLGQPVTTAILQGQTQCTLRSAVSGQQNWTAETPHLYTAAVTLNRGSRPVHAVAERIGFRTFQVRQDGLFLNGRRILLKGVNRHSFRPDTGRCLSPQDDRDDVLLIKAMNMNAVRCSHYPPNRSFLRACDEIGLYALDELAGWQKPPYDTAVGKELVREMVHRDVNHPCILFWDNGNEGGWNTELDAEFAKYDPQNRPVLHPWADFGGIDTDHYETYESTLKKLSGPSLFMPTEFLHGLYDGGHGASLNDYWNAMKQSPYGAGGFLWVLADEGVKRTDLNGKLDTDGNHAPDGIVGPYHEKESSFYTIREIWSPVQVHLDTIGRDFDGTVPVENGYAFCSLDQVQFTWQLVEFADAFSDQAGHTVGKEGSLQGPAVSPGSRGGLQLELPDGWNAYDALYLTATDPQGQDLWTWSWPLNAGLPPAIPGFEQGSTARLDAVSQDDAILVTAGAFQFTFGAEDGLLQRVSSAKGVYALTKGPRLIPAAAATQTPVVTCTDKEGVYVLHAEHGESYSFQWTIYPQGLLLLEYGYALAGQHEAFGITFDLPETGIKSMRWLGQGPGRVWKNRLRGGRLDVWQRDYNQGITGFDWQYPEFAGCYADLRWLELQTVPGAVRVFNAVEDVFFRVGQLRNAPNPQNAQITPLDGDLSFLHAVSPIGTKFLKASDLGPAAQLTVADGVYSGQLLFQFE
jgi:hypothetical protein